MLSDEERELIEKIQNGNKIGIYELIRTFKREGIENFITVRRKYIDIMINLIEKQQKEIEELKENNKLLQENYSSAHEDINWFCENYISKEESEQRERKAYIKGTNDAHELCNKKWEDEIKAKIEELEKQDKESKLSHNYLVIPVLQSLLEKE